MGSARAQAFFGVHETPTAERPFARYLPGRLRPVLLCHAEPWTCPACHRQVAAFLAEEMGWELLEAIDRGLTEYQAEFGVENCSLALAAEVRMLTVQACVDRHAPGHSPSDLRRALGLRLPCQAPPIVADPAPVAVVTELTPSQRAEAFLADRAATAPSAAAGRERERRWGLLLLLAAELGLLATALAVGVWAARVHAG